jgi:ribosomal protein L11 methylase PrmA
MTQRSLINYWLCLSCSREEKELHALRTMDFQRVQSTLTETKKQIDEQRAVYEGKIHSTTNDHDELTEELKSTRERMIFAETQVIKLTPYKQKYNEALVLWKDEVKTLQGQLDSQSKNKLEREDVLRRWKKVLRVVSIYSFVSVHPTINHFPPPLETYSPPNGSLLAFFDSHFECAVI